MIRLLYQDEPADVDGIKTVAADSDYLISGNESLFPATLDAIDIEVNYFDLIATDSIFFTYGYNTSGSPYRGTFSAKLTNIYFTVWEPSTNTGQNFTYNGAVPEVGNIKVKGNAGNMEIWLDDILVVDDLITVPQGALNISTEMAIGCVLQTFGVAPTLFFNTEMYNLKVNSDTWLFDEHQGLTATSDLGTVLTLSSETIWNSEPGSWKELDVDQDDTIRVSKQLMDYKDPSQRKSDFSKAFSLPFSDTNNRFFNIFYDPTFEGATFSPYSKVEVLLYEGNDLIIQGPMQLLSIDREKPFYKVRVFGTLNTLKTTLGDSLLSELDWSEYDHEFSGANILLSWDGLLPLVGGGTTADILYPVSDWGKGYGLNGYDITINANPIEANDFYPSMRYQTMIEQIFSKNNLVLDLSLFTYPVFNDIFYQLYVEKEKSIKQRDFYFLADNVGNTFVVPDGGSETEVLNFESVSDPEGLFNNLTNEYVCGANGNYDFSYSNYGEWAADGAAGTCTVTTTIQRNGIDIGGSDTEIINKAAGTQGGNFTQVGSVAAVPLVIGDTIRVSQVVDTVSTAFQVGMIDPSEFKLVTAPTVFIGGILDISKTMGEVKQIDVIKSFLNYFNLVLDQDPDIQQNYRVISYDDWLDEGTQRDYTEYVDVSKSVIVKPATQYMSKSINYTLLKANDDLNRTYRDTTGRDYGALFLPSDIAYSNGEQKLFTIFAPYPTSNVNGIDNMFIARYFKDPEKPSLEKIAPQLFIYNGTITTTVGYYLDDHQGGAAIINDYPACSNFKLNGSGRVDSTSQDLNMTFSYPFDGEKYVDATTQLTVYNQFHKNYNSRLYDLGNRIVECFFYLTSKEYTELKMNDQLIVNLSGSPGKYIILSINEYPVNGSDSVKLILMKA